MKQKNLSINIVLNIIRSLLTIIFPLITYPYAAKILLPTGIGKYNYVISIISYYQLISTLGINTYAITEGAKIRSDKNKLNAFCNEVLWLNVVSTTIAYVLLAATAFWGFFDNCLEMLLICSVTILFNMMGMNWFYSIEEDFFYVTLRTVFFQIISIVLLFVIIKKPEDLNTYCWLSVISTGGSNLCNILFLRKKIKICLNPFSINWHSIKNMLKPVSIIFFASAASTIYMNSDKIMLGIFWDNYAVGIYSTSVKIVSVVMTIIVAFREVLLPRLSYYISNSNIDLATELMYKGLSAIYMFTIPCIVGIVLMRNDLIIFISSIEYITASKSLSILCFELIFAPISAFLAYQILIPLGKISVVTLSTIIGSLVNVVLNLFLIPIVRENGAAITTVMAEMIVFLVLYHEIRKVISLNKLKNEIVQYCMGAILIIPVILLCRNISNDIVRLIFTLTVSVLLYVGFLLLMHNTMIHNCCIKLMRFVIRK